MGTEKSKKRTRPPRRQSRLPPVDEAYVMNIYHGLVPEKPKRQLTNEAVNGTEPAEPALDLMDVDDEDLADATERQQQEILEKSRPFRGELVDSKDQFAPLDYNGFYDYYADTWELKALQYSDNRNPSPPRFKPPQNEDSNSALATRFILNAINPPYLRAPREKCLATTMLYRAQRDTHRVANLFPYRYYVGGSSDFIDLDWHPDNNRFALSAICSDDDYNRPGNFCFGNVLEDKCTSISTHARWKETGEPYYENSNVRPDPALHTFYTVSDVKFVNDGRYYTTSGYDGNCKVWDSETLRCTHSFATFPGKGHNERLATMSAQSSLVAVMSIPDDQARQGPVPLVCVSEEGKAKMIGSFVVPDKKNMKPDCLTFAGNDLAVGYRGVFRNTEKWGYLALFDTHTTKPKMAWKKSAMAHSDLSYHPGGWVVAASHLRKGERESPSDNQMIRVLDTRQQDAVFEAYLPQYDINRVTISPCATFITASCTDASTTVWDWRIGERVFAQLKHQANPLYENLPDREREDKDTGVTVALWQDGNMLITGASDGAVNRWDLRKPFDPPQVLADMANCVMSAKFSPNWEHLLVGDAGGHALLLNPRGVDGPNDEDADLPDHPVFGARNALRNIRRFKMTHSSGKS